MHLDLVNHTLSLQRQQRCGAAFANPTSPNSHALLAKTPLPRQYGHRRTYKQVCRTSATDNGAFVPVEWESDEEVHDKESLQLKTALLERFKAADTDGYGF